MDDHSSEGCYTLICHKLAVRVIQELYYVKTMLRENLMPECVKQVFLTDSTFFKTFLLSPECLLICLIFLGAIKGTKVFMI